MLYLNNGCYCSTPSVSPKNWDKPGAKITSDWYIRYCFFDPTAKEKYPKGKVVIIKSGINYAKTLSERREAVKFVLKRVISQLSDEGYNPITGTYNGHDVADYEISPSTLFLPALQKSLERLEVSALTKINIRSTLKYFSLAVKQLRYDSIEIQHVKRKHIRFALEHCKNVKPYWSNSLFNNYRRDLSMLMNELIETETIEFNPIDKIAKLPVLKKVKRLPTFEERKVISDALKEKNYLFWRFVHIFFSSGSRISELVQVRQCDVDLENMQYLITVKKGKRLAQVWKPIKQVVLKEWTEAVSECIHPTDYLFSLRLKTGPKQTNPRSITKMWNRFVKAEGKLNIQVDLYSLKHLHTTEVLDLLSSRGSIVLAEKAAAELNGHTSSKMVKEVYDTKNAIRKNEELRRLPNTFA